MSEYNVSQLDINISNAMHRICIKYEKEVNNNGRD